MGCAAIVVVSFFVTLLVLEVYDVSVPDEVRKGSKFHVVFDQKYCDANLESVFSCSRSYEGQYNLATNSWTISGRTRASADIMTRADTNAPSAPGSITIWGARGTFDRSGRLTLGAAGEVGKVDLIEKSWPLSWL